MGANRTEYADDATLRSSNSSSVKACEMTNRDGAINRADRTVVFVVTPDGKERNAKTDITFGVEKLKVVKSKKVLGITVDSQLNFREHIQAKTKAGFRTLKWLDSFNRGNKNCSQSIYMRLYNALVPPFMDYGAAVLGSATAECSKEMGKVHRKAMLKASGCLSSTNTDVLEVLTNTVPLDLLLNKGASPHSNNYLGELMGIQISLQCLAESDQLRDRNSHVFTD